MSTHVATDASKRVQSLHAQPWTLTARTSGALRKYLDAQEHVTPHFSWAEFACHDPENTPVPESLRPNTIRLCWLLEQMRHELGDVSMRIGSGYRTQEWNKHVGGAADSRHTHADAADFMADDVDAWIANGAAADRAAVVDIANRIFSTGGVGNETSGTLHVDARGWKARFVTWVAAT